MQTGAEVPLFADATVRYPVLAFSHGYGGSPLSNDYIAALSWFASYGFVVVAPFHGDPRFSDLKIDDLSDVMQSCRISATSSRCRHCDRCRCRRRSTSCSRIRNGATTSMQRRSEASGRAWAAKQ